MLHSIRRVLRHFADRYAFARVCAVCGTVLEPDERLMCMHCLLTMPRCRERGVSMIDGNAPILNAAIPVAMVEAWIIYDPASDYASLIRDAKYNDRPGQARELGRLFAADLLRRPFADGEVHPDGIDVLLPVPMHWTKRMRRGYNQSEEIALGMAEVLGCATGDNLVAVKPHGTQTKLSYSGRARNIKGCFAIEHGDELEGLNVAVVDDIITTGASMGEAAMALSTGAAGAASLSFLSIGATHRR